MAAWLTNRSLAASTRQSAGTMSPADSTIRSPGTSRVMFSSCCTLVLPAALSSLLSLRRSTVAVLLTSALSRSAARWERPSCTKRISVDSTTMLPITTVALASSVSQETAASAVSSRLKGFWYDCHRCSQAGRGFSCSTSLGPTRADALGLGLAQTLRIAAGTHQHGCRAVFARLAQRLRQRRRHRHGVAVRVQRLQHQAPAEMLQPPAAAQKQREAGFEKLPGHFFFQGTGGRGRANSLFVCMLARRWAQACKRRLRWQGRLGLGARRSIALVQSSAGLSGARAASLVFNGPLALPRCLGAGAGTGTGFSHYEIKSCQRRQALGCKAFCCDHW